MKGESVVADARASKNSKSATDDLVETLLVGAAKVIGLLAWWAVRFPLVEHADRGGAGRDCVG